MKDDIILPPLHYDELPEPDDFVNSGTSESRKLIKFLNDKGVSSTVLREWNPRYY